ncbi:unnamed protein product [Heligmosomoides polygyrus]|uniref:Propep_M14 domain-containing protein n=1 Tax=Heligmosomoides polygyrus TaxID=6339 RepID=A0A183FRB5_HELPZ|nr:unnamed protein product [Heligmosomoides polygyrus]
MTSARSNLAPLGGAGRLLPLAIALAHLVSTSVTAEKYMLYHVQPNDARGMRELRKLQMQDHKYQVDFWKEPNHIGDFADIMISSKFALAMEHRFRRANMTYDIRVPDVEKLIIRNERSWTKPKGKRRRLNDDPILDSERHLEATTEITSAEGEWILPQIPPVALFVGEDSRKVTDLFKWEEFHSEKMAYCVPIGPDVSMRKLKTFGFVAIG